MPCLLFLAAGRGEVPTAPPEEVPTLVVEQPSAPLAQDSTLAPDQFTVPLPPTVTPIPYPLPTREPFSPRPLPTATSLPKVIVLGAEWAPAAERETYVSTTVVVTKVGDGPGELGLYRPPEPERLPSVARSFTVDVRGNIYILDVVNQRVVKFDTQGQFVGNIVYGDAVSDPEDLAVDAEGRVYIYEAAAYGPTPEEAVPKVKLFDPGGKLLWETPVPSWFMSQLILAMRVDEQGTLWVEGNGCAPNAPVIDGQPYGVAAVPLGNSVQPFNEERQKAMSLPGHLLPNGKTMIVYMLPAGSAFIYDLQGNPIYEPTVGISSIDMAGNLYHEKRMECPGIAGALHGS